MHQKNHNRIVNILNFLGKYWVTVALLVALSALFHQNFVINQFPKSLYQKQQIIDGNIRINQALATENAILSATLKSDANQEVLESQARYRFGMVKPDEIYYQIRP